MNLPFGDDAFDAALAVLTVHHWADQVRGLCEMKRVARRLVILTWEIPPLPSWLTRDYFPEMLLNGRELFPPIVPYFSDVFGCNEVLPVPIPHDCTDGFLEAYWRKPEAYFNPALREAISAFANLNAEAGLSQLRRDLEYGTWMRRNGHLMDLTELVLGYRIVVAHALRSRAGVAPAGDSCPAP